MHINEYYEKKIYNYAWKHNMNMSFTLLKVYFLASLDILPNIR